VQVAAHAVSDGESDDERGNSGSNAGYGDGCDHADNGLPPLGSEISRRQKQFKSHCALAFLKLLFLGRDDRFGYADVVVPIEGADSDEVLASLVRRLLK